ncbi:MAG TPA: hypothetical protein DCK76_07235 [Desulfotomaculum sp.]|nr:MAG: hypothetical protein XD84_0742 [Desulfotomaculum sp. 46_80]KUK85226.1 MAG: hypothetical protein XE00_0169 [Desulfofundulus kuznetsovii]HAG11161.1 hypothetical protein [Desulfotomaculum sp.]HBY03270.1 hypothetical protein [Desulfotomaculum sp.]
MPAILTRELTALLIQDFPESIVCVMVVFSFLCLRFDFKKITAIAVLQTVTNLVRLLPIAFGVHTVVLVISLAVYVHLITKIRLSRVFLTVIGTFVICGLVEMIYMMPLLNLTGRTYEEFFANPVLRELYSLPYELVLLAVALGKNYYNRRRGKISA